MLIGVRISLVISEVSLCLLCSRIICSWSRRCIKQPTVLDPRLKLSTGPGLYKFVISLKLSDHSKDSKVVVPIQHFSN